MSDVAITVTENGPLSVKGPFRLVARIGFDDVERAVAPLEDREP